MQTRYWGALLIELWVCASCSGAIGPDAGGVPPDGGAGVGLSSEDGGASHSAAGPSDAGNTSAVDAGGSPALQYIVINELSASNDDAIELFNLTDVDVDLGGCALSDSGYDPADPLTTAEQRYEIPSGTRIPARGYRVFRKDIDHLFGLSQGGDSVTLWGPLDQKLDEVTYLTDEAVTSYCRLPNGTGAFTSCAVETFGSENTN